jgi:anaerobic magnesium-protoporphyrin IX monomethyl ester cyclase
MITSVPRDSLHVDCLLLFPPVWDPSSPYLSLPTLAAYLEHNGWRVGQLDLNLRFWLRLLSTDCLKSLHGLARDRTAHPNVSPLGYGGYESRRFEDLAFTVDVERAILTAACMPESRFVEEMQSGAIDRRSIVCLANAFAADLGLAAPLGDVPGGRPLDHYSAPFLSALSYADFATSSESLRRAVEARWNFFIGFYSKVLLPVLERMQPPIVGISVVHPTQVVAAFTAARAVRESGVGSHVVLGGPWVTQVWPTLKKTPDLFRHVDSMVAGPGETPLLALLGDKGQKCLSAAPNLIFRDGSRIIETESRPPLSINETPTPRFNAAERELYWGDTDELALYPSRGCHYGRCTFCSFTSIEGCYEPRDTELLLSDIDELRRRFGVRRIHLTHSSLSAKQARGLARGLIAKGTQVSWRSFCRFDPWVCSETLEQLARSGCWKLDWGLESASVRILQLFRKGIDPARASQILEASRGIGIANEVEMIYGWPTETYAEAFETVRFYEDNAKNIDFYNYSLFCLERGSAAQLLSAQHGVMPTQSCDNSGDLATNYPFERSMTAAELRSLEIRMSRVFRRPMARLADQAAMIAPADRTQFFELKPRVAPTVYMIRAFDTDDLMREAWTHQSLSSLSEPRIAQFVTFLCGESPGRRTGDFLPLEVGHILHMCDGTLTTEEIACRLAVIKGIPPSQALIEVVCALERFSKIGMVSLIGTGA